jgi:hypothetical protein
MQPAAEWATAWAERRRSGTRNGSAVYECEQRAGDVIVLPDLWGHVTLNLQTSVGVAQEFAYE